MEINTINRGRISALCSLVILFVVVFLGGLVAPTLVVMRDASRATQCQDNLRELGAGIESFHNNDEMGRFCTGARDWKRDGCPDTYGWVADLVNAGLVRPAEHLCPSNGPPVTTTDNDLLGFSTHQDQPNRPKDGLEVAYDGPVRFLSGLCRNFGFEDSQIANRPAAVGAFHERGYTTNYAASWFFVRSSLKINIVTYNQQTNAQTMGTQLGSSGAYSGLRYSDLYRASVASSAVPIIGDAARERSEKLANDILTSHVSASYAKGTNLLESFGRGPVCVNIANGSDFLTISEKPTILLGDQGTLTGDLQPTKGERGTNERHGGVDKRVWLQDTRSWASIHGVNQRFVNLVFADWSVRAIYDLNGDGYLNPGFPIDLRRPSSLLGYTDNVAELGPDQLYSLPALNSDQIIPNPCACE